MAVLPPWSVLDTIANVGSPARRADAKRNHIYVFNRYISPTTGIDKVAFKAEIDDLLADGFGVVANYERGAGDWRLGPAVARQAGAWARNYVSGTGTTKVNGVVVPCWGWPESTQIAYSIDTGVQTSELALAAQVMRAFSEASGRPQDLYGPSNVGVYCVTLGVAQHFWQWKDGSRPNTIHTNIRQNYATPYELGYSYDTNTPVTEDFGQHYAAGPPPPPPPDPTKDDDMQPYVLVQDGATVWRAASNGQSRLVTAGASFEWDKTLLIVNGYKADVFNTADPAWKAWLESIPGGDAASQALIVATQTKALVEKIPTTPTAVDVALVARAVNDEAARRLAS